jgi:hydrogenase maturation protease
MGVGNVLMGDDALGPFVIESLQAAFELPGNVTVLDAGTPGLDLTLFLDGFDAIIAIDALQPVKPPGHGQAQGKPGDVRAFRRKELLAGGLPIVLSPHEPTLREALFRLDVLGRCPPDVLLVGAYPERVETGTGLSPAVRAAVPFIEVQVLRELQRLGSRAVPRREPQPARIWWEAPAVI